LVLAGDALFNIIRKSGIYFSGNKKPAEAGFKSS
jgi:hypothetical protein